MARKYAYKDVAQPLFQETLKGHNTNTLRLVKTVAEFAQKVSLAHEQFANQVQNLAEVYVKKNQELKKERPVECHSSLCAAWETLLQETQYDAQAHADIASLLVKTVCNPLLEISSYKKNQARRLYSFRENFESMLQTSEETVQKCYKAYVKAYQNYRNNMNTREATKHLSAYHSAHNEYILHIQTSNRQEQEYHEMALPYLLEELEEIHIDLANTLNGGIESHALLLLTKANEQGKRFEGILKVCKLVNPKNDVHNFLLTIIREPSPCEPREYTFTSPCDRNIPGSELMTLNSQVIQNRHTELSLNALRQSLQKEAAELASYLKQSQAVMQTLTNVCQRNLANHLQGKVYETQDDLCRKRNEIRLANLQLAMIKSQIELLSPRQNGTAVEVDKENPSTKSNRASIIRGMWKKAFKGLKSNKPKEKGDQGNKIEKDSEREKDDKIKVDGSEDKKNSKQTVRQSSLKKMMKRKDSKESQKDSVPGDEIDDLKYSYPPPPDPNVPADPIFSTLKEAATKRRQQSSTSTSDDPGADAEDIDPVYSLLKCAADLPRSGKPGSTGHGCCSQKTNNDNITLLSNSRSSSPSSAKLKSKSLLKLRENSPSPSGSLSSMAKYRRVRFQQENKKSQSLETPYHHSHQQHKLHVDMEGDLHERSFSATSIPQCAKEKGIQRMASLAPPRHPPMHYQRSISLDDISMSSASEHEKWEKEAIAEHTSSWRRQPSSSSSGGGGGGGGGSSSSSKQQGLLDLRRAAFRQQRSYSHNDISPCTEHEKWEKEGVIDNLISNTRNTTSVKGAAAPTGKASTEPTEPSPTVDNSASSSLPAAAAATTASPSSPPSQLQEQQQSTLASSSSLLALASQTISTTTTTSSSSSATTVSHNAKRDRLPSPPQLESASLTPSSQQDHPVEHRVHSPLPNNTSETLREDSFDPCTWSPIEDSDHGAIDDGQKKRASSAASSSSKSRIPSRIPTKQVTRQDSGSSNGSQSAKTSGKVEARSTGNSVSESCDKTVMASRDSRTNTGSSSRAPKSPRDSGQHYSSGQRRSSGRPSIDHGVHESSSRRMSGQTSTGQRPVARRTSKDNMATGSPRTEHRGSRDAGVPAVSSNRSTRRLSREAATDSSGYSKSDRRQSREYYQPEIEPHGSRHSRDSVTPTSSRRYSGSVEGQRSQGQGYRSETQGRSSQRPDNQVPHGYRTHENIPRHEDAYHKARSDGRSDGRSDLRPRHADVQSGPSGSKMKGGATADKMNQKVASRSQAESRRNRESPAEPSVTDLGPAAPGGDLTGRGIVFQRSPADRPQSLTRRDEEMVSSTQSPRIRQWNREMTLAPTKAAVPRQPHRRSLPVITTEMYQSSELRSGDSTEKATTRSPRNKTLLLLHERKSRSFDSTFDERHQGQGYASHGEFYQIDVESQEEFCRTYQDKLKHISRDDTQDTGDVDNYPARHDSSQRSPRHAEYDAYHTETLEQSHEVSPRRTKEVSPRRDKGLSPRREERELRQKSPQKSPREELREYFERGRSQRQEPTAYPSPHEKRKDVSPKSNRDVSPYESSDYNRQRSPRRQQEEGFDSLDCADSRGHSDRGQGERGASRRHLPSPRRSDAQQVSPKHTADQSELYYRQDNYSDNRSRYDRGDPYQPSNSSVDNKPDYPRHRHPDTDSGYSTSAQRPVDPFRDRRHRFPELGQSESSESRSQDGKAHDKRGSMQSTSKRHLLKLMHKKKSQSFDGPYEYMSGEKDSRSDSASETDRTKMRRKQCFQQQKSYSVDSPYDLPNAEGSELIKSTTRTGEIVTQLTITEPITLSGFSANSAGSVEPEPEKPSNEAQPNTQYSYLNVPGAGDPSDKKQNKFVHQKSHSVDVAEGNNMPADDGKRLLETKPLQQSYPSDSKSNDLSNIRKKSIGDLMNELQKLKDERKKALKQAVADFHDMASRQTTAGPEQEPSPNDNNKEAVNARRNRFHQQKSYSLDTPQAVRYKSIADIPYHPPVRDPAPLKQEAEPSGGSVSNSRSSSSSNNNKSNPAVKAKRMSQFQQQKSYSLDMIEEHSSRQHAGSGTEPGQSQHQRRRVASDSSDRPPPSEPGSYGSNRQKLMQLRAMKLLPDQDHDHSPSTPPDLKTTSRPTRLYAPNSQQDYVSTKPVAPRDYGSYPRDRDPQRDYSPRRGSGYDGEGVFENEVGTYLEAKDRDRDRDRDKGRHLSPSRHREHSLSPHRDSEGYSGRTRQLSPSSRDGGSKHTSPARHGRGDVSHSSPSRPRGTSPGGYDRRDFISPGWEGECSLDTNPHQPVEGSSRQQYMSLSRSDLLQAIKDRLELSPFLEKAKQDFNAVPQSPPQRTPRKKLNARMKSFSLDTPDPPRPMAVIDESSKKKTTSPGQGQGQLRPRFWGRSSSFDVDDSCESQSPHSVASLSPRSGNSRNNSGPSSPKTQRRSISANAFAVLYNFKGKEKGDLDLRAGWRVNAIDTTDADWWKGKSNGRIGYFPSNYVTRLHPGEQILQVSHAFEVSAQEHGQAVRLLKDQIVIREGEDTGGMVMIRTASDVHFPCPVKYLAEVSS